MRFIKNWSLLSILFLLLASPCPASPQSIDKDYSEQGTTFEQASSQIADWTSAFLVNRGANAISADFQSILGCPSGSRSAFIEHLKTRLGPKNIFIKHPQKCDFRLIAFLADPEKSSGSLVIRPEIRNRAGEIVAQYDKTPITVSNNSDIAQLIGFNSGFKPGSDAKKAILKAIDKRVLWLSADSTIAYEGDNALFGMSVRKNNQPIPIIEGTANSDEEGSGFVDLPLNQEYTIQLFNNAPYEVAVDLRIDGLNVFHFCEPKSRKPDGGPKHWVLKPKSAMEVRGWFKNPKDLTAFKTTLEENSAVALAGLPLDEIGIIGATFSASWEEGKTKPPPDEPDPLVTTRTGGIGTGQGRELQQNAKIVDRVVGKSRAYVGLRYRREN